MSRYVDPSTETPEAITPVDSALADTPVDGMGAGSASAGGRFGSPVRDDSDGKDSLADEDGDDSTVNLSNGIRITFIRRAGWPKQPTQTEAGGGATSPTASLRGASESKQRPKVGKKVSPFAQVTLDYSLLKAIDTVGGTNRYAPFDYASDKPLADRMVPGDVYESCKGFEIKYIPSYQVRTQIAIQGLNLAFPYLREGDEALIFTPDYLGPAIVDLNLGEVYRPKPAMDETTQTLVEPPKPPVANNTYSEHSFIRVHIKKVCPEEVLDTDRYLTKTIIAEGRAGTKLSFDETNSEVDNAAVARALADTHTLPRRCTTGSSVTYDIGEVNEFLGKPAYFKTVKDFLVGGGTSCPELDTMLLTMHVGEFSSFRVGATQYHIKLLDIAAGSAKGEAVGDAATSLARMLKDVGNEVLNGSLSASSKAFSSPIKPSKMGSPSPSSEAAFEADRYFPPPSDLTYNPILDSLSTFVVRPPRSSYLRCWKPAKVPAKEAHAARAKDELSFRALKLYQAATNILYDEDREYYFQESMETDNAVSLSPSRSPPSASKRDRTVMKPIPYNSAQRFDLLGTVCGNIAQVYLSLDVYESADRSATLAIKYCASSDTYKQYFRRAKARRNLLRIEEAISDIREAEAALKALNVKAGDGRYVELQKELALCEGALQDQRALSPSSSP